MIFDSPALSQQPGAKKSWQSVDKIPQNRPASDAWVHPGKNFHAFNVDHGSLRAELARVPKEFSNQARIAPGEISLPMPDGSLARFKVVESPVMAPELAAKFPEIKTYLGQGIDDPQASVRFDTTPAGFHAQILSPKGAVYIDPYWRGDAVLHTSYYKRDYQKAADGFQCLAPTVDVANEKPVAQRDLLRSGNNLRTYRLACAATGEYVAYHGGTVVAGMSAIVTAVNRVTGIYEVELAIRLVLVANNDLVVYTIGGSDPYSNASGSTMLGQNQANLDSEIGDANYDIGHVFSTGGGGIAGLGVVCRSSNKARGVTGFPSPIGDAFYVDYVAHEMGHQFGGNHTFNSVTSSCGGPNRNTLTAYEPGSGSTIMAYAGICAGDNLQPHSDSYFHSGSFDEILAYSTSGLGSGCPVLTATGNTAPTVNAGTNFVIPKSTPFTLTATGSDADGDLLSFCWEERDLGADQVLTDGDNGSSPIFRSLNPTASPSRTFPTLTSLLNNTSILGEKLPTTSRTMNFRVTARDNRPDGGGVNTANMQVTVNSSVGPFLVVSPNSAVTWSNLQTVTWSVAGTTSAPVNVASVNILLSTNGGNSFPISLATNTPNDGSEIIRLPSISNSLARIKIEAVGNIFFDISNTNFSIVPFVPVAIDSTALIAENCSPGNNAIDPSETVIVNFALKNIGLIDTTNLTATLLATNGVTPLSGAQNYGALVAGGGAVTQAFVFSASGSCGGTIRPTFQLQDGATNLGTINIPLTLGSVTFVSLTNSNSTPIVIPASGNSGPTSPYPSPVTISGASGVLSKATVSLLNLSHTFPDDIDVLLVAPNGQTVLLMSDAGGSTSISNVNLTFDSLAATALPDSSPLVSGTYLPTDFEAGEAFTAPAPTGPYGLSLTNLNGMNPNGTWSLYIIDDSNPNKGSIAGGWQLTLTTSIATCCASNSPPVITSVSNQITDEDVPLSGISFTVSDAETAANALIITTNSSNTNLVANSGLAISGTGTNRSLAITPLLNQSGNSTITISVSDGQSTTNTTFLLTVNPVNDAPVVATIPSPMTINEGALLQFTNSATDVEGNQLTFSLDPGFPGGASIDPITGVFTWTPTEAQAPATNSITVRVTDNGSPNLSGTRTFTVIANEVNAAPALAEIPSPVTIDEGTLLIFTNSATDVEGDQLTFILEPGFPAGAAINPTNGVFTWTPTEAQGPGTNSITIRVTDNG
ncbi:MAG: reprolysin-like metallopeptidase, partial [Verrucomicrobiota bacterium]